MNIYQGDPAINMTQNGATLVFKAGQPVMDSGVENVAQISLFTAEDWAGNFLFDTPAQNIGSDFEKTAQKTITRSSLSLVEKSAENALKADIFGTVRAIASNPKSWQTDVVIRIQPPGRTASDILLTKNGQNWINQAATPAHERV